MTEDQAIRKLDVISVIYYFSNPWNKPLTQDEFTATFGYSDGLDEDEKALLNKHTVVCKDGFIRVRHLGKAIEWRKRRGYHVRRNWNAIGI